MLKGHLTILIAVDGNTLKLTLVMTLFGGRMSSVEELSRLHFTLTVEELLHVTCNQTAVSPIHESARCQEYSEGQFLSKISS